MVPGMMGYCGGGGLARAEMVSYAPGHAAKGIINVDGCQSLSRRLVLLVDWCAIKARLGKERSRRLATSGA